MDKIPALKPGEPAYIDTLKPDLLGLVFTYTESFAAERIVSKNFLSASQGGFFCNYFFCQLQSMVRNDLSDDFDSLIDRQKGDTWFVLNQKAMKYFNDLSKLTGFGPIVLPKNNGEYISINLMTIYQGAYQKIIDKNFITCVSAIDDNNVATFLQNNKGLSLQELSALARNYLQENNASQEKVSLKIKSVCLCLSNKNLTLFPSEICEFVSATMFLSLSSNPLRTLPMSFPKLVDLTQLELDLNQNPREKFPSALLKVSSLTSLRLCGGKGTIFPESFGNLATTLFNFEFYSEPFEDLSPSISSPMHLTRVCLNDTPIKNFPSCLLGLSNLRTLTFGSIHKPMEANEPMNFPESFDRLTNLTQLSFPYYPITNPPESLSSLTNLTTLNFNYTKIAVFPPWILRLTNLCNLFFEHTPLDEEYKKNNNLSNRLHEGLPNLNIPRPYSKKKPWGDDFDKTDNESENTSLLHEIP